VKVAIPSASVIDEREKPPGPVEFSLRPLTGPSLVVTFTLKLGPTGIGTKFTEQAEASGDVARAAARRAMDVAIEP
jgi:hypothetical protein